ncbi:MAG: DegT/DnrJ/EryC1/StrS family aminotransferase [Sulfurovum sp.]|nr:DegT/DnrJ/EryC1/StrS family aminotransferase [Sulfurovum sp.]
MKKHQKIDFANLPYQYQRYKAEIDQAIHKVLPFIAPNTISAFLQYSIRVQNRDEVQAQLKAQGIPTAVHYPLPLHLQECFAY